MKEVILSGYSEGDFDEVLKHGEKPGCYICKRKPGEKGVFLAKDGGNEGMGSIELDFEFYEIKSGNKKFLYPLCHECRPLFESQQKDVEIQKTSRFGKISLN